MLSKFMFFVDTFRQSLGHGRILCSVGSSLLRVNPCQNYCNCSNGLRLAEGSAEPGNVFSHNHVGINLEISKKVLFHH